MRSEPAFSRDGAPAFGLHWLWAAAAACAVFAFLLPQGASLLADPDTYWHIRAGNWMLQHRHVPLTDPFSFTAAGAAWTPHEWLADIVMALTFTAGGWTGLAVLTLAVFALSLAMLWQYCARFLKPAHVAIMVVLSFMLLTGHLLARPHVLAMPAQILWFIGLANARDGNRAPSVWLLPVMTVWANMHGSYILGLGFAAMLAAEALIAAQGNPARIAVLRGWGLFGLLSLGAVLVNPLGVWALLLPFKMTGIADIRMIGEWKSPDFQGLQPFGVWLALVLFGAVTLGVRLPASRAAMLVLLLSMALKHQRHIDLIALIAPVLLARPLGEQLRTRFGAALAIAPATAPRAAIAIAAAALACAAGSFALLPGAGLRPGDDAVTPGAALRAAAQAGVAGPVLNDWNFGGYLIFRGIPTFIDGRADPFSDALIGDHGAAVNGNAAKLQLLLDRHKIAWTLLTPGRPANDLLDHLPGWRRLYADKYAVVHVRADPPTPNLVSQTSP